MFKTVTLIGLCAVAFLCQAENLQAENPKAEKLDAFHNGPAIASFGKIASVDTDMKIPKNTHFKIAFDVGLKAEPGEINRTLNTAARFINMHVEAGVPLEKINVAVVVHGSASSDLTHNAFYKKHHDGQSNVNVKAISTLLNNNTRIILCGQTAAYRGIAKNDLTPGVEMALSAMTAHALLLQDGYTPNPF